MSTGAMDLPLDEIIRRNKIKPNKKLRRPKNLGKKGSKTGVVLSAGKKNVNTSKVKGKKRASAGTVLAQKTNTAALALLTGGGGGAKKMIDARLKIIEKTRSKIRDARERLNERMKETDARERIRKRTGASGGVSKMRSDQPVPRRTIRNNSPRLQPDNYPYGAARSDPFRTIKNGVRGSGTAYMDMTPPPPFEWSPQRFNTLPRLEVHVSRKEPTRPMGELEKMPLWPNTATPPYRAKENVKARLEPVHQEGYRIVVSNLQPTVTHEDIKELFEDIGELVRSRVVRPGTAEVVYKNMNDALLAVDTYHNRQLDGQPMKCLLVKPSNSSKNLNTKGSIVPDIDAVHKALFTK